MGGALKSSGDASAMADYKATFDAERAWPIGFTQDSAAKRCFSTSFQRKGLMMAAGMRTPECTSMVWPSYLSKEG